jgi:hypothetical protein
MDLVLSIMALAVIALPLAAFVLWRKGGSKKQVVLLLVLALIVLANVAILIIPDSSGNSPAKQAASLEE